MQILHPMVEAILMRRSVRHYTARPVEETMLNQILLAGIHAPSAHDSRPWKVAAVTSAEGKQRLTGALSSRFQKDMEAAGFSPEETERRLARSQGIFASAPVLVVLFARRNLPANPLAKTGETEQLLTAQSVALAAGQMLLAASHLGLSGCWFAAPLFCPGEVCTACGLDKTQWFPQCLLTLGYPAQEPKEKVPPRLEDCVVRL